MRLLSCCFFKCLDRIFCCDYTELNAQFCNLVGLIVLDAGRSLPFGFATSLCGPGMGRRQMTSIYKQRRALGKRRGLAHHP